MSIDFREREMEGEREREREREKEKYQCERETSIGCFPYASRPGVKPAF